MGTRYTKTNGDLEFGKYSGILYVAKESKDHALVFERYKNMEYISDIELPYDWCEDQGEELTIPEMQLLRKINEEVL